MASQRANIAKDGKRRKETRATEPQDNGYTSGLGIEKLYSPSIDDGRGGCVHREPGAGLFLFEQHYFTR